MSTRASFKQIQIDKANLRIVIAVSVAVFIVFFCAVATKSLVSRQLYQNKVIESREKARDQLQANIEAAGQLTESYKNFVANTPNIIGGSPIGGGERDGDNARLVLDALPSVYDFPALTSSVEKLANDNSLAIGGITGTDDEVNQKSQSSSSPQVVDMPFTLTVNGSYQNINALVLSFERSIRPFKVGKVTFTGGGGDDVSMTLDAKSYYQPARNLDIKKEVVK